MSDDQWKPIETAPDDGTHILVWDERIGLVPAMFDGKTWRSSWDREGFLRPEDFTHWMPEPAAPGGRKP